jgi:hypothetical protein
MEYISEQPILKNGRLISMIRYEMLSPKRINEIIEGYKKNETDILLISVSKNGIANVLCNPLSNQYRIIIASLFSRSNSLFKFIEDLLNRAKELKETNF